MPKKTTLACAMCAASIAAAPATAQAETITMSGSTSVAPLASALAKSFKSSAGRGHSFRLFQGGSDIGIADVARGRVDIGNSSRDPKPSDPGGIVFNKIARDALCIATHPANPVPNLSNDQVQAIFSGRVRNWSDVPGARASGPITLVVRTPASGSQDAFQQIFMGQTLRVAGSASQKASNGLVQQTLRRDKNAIGYLSFDFIGGTHAISYAGVACTLRNAKSGQYGGTRNFWMVTRGKPKGVDEEVHHLDPQERNGAGGSPPSTGCRSPSGRRCPRQHAPPRRRHGARRSSDRPAELVLGGLSVVVLVLIAGMVIFVFAKAWPSFAHNGLGWFTSGGDANQQMIDIFNSPANPNAYVYELHAWPLLYSTALVTGMAVVWGTVFSVFAAIFIVEFAPAARAADRRAGRAPAGRRPVGRLRPDRDPRRSSRSSPSSSRTSARSRSSTSSS